MLQSHCREYLAEEVIAGKCRAEKIKCARATTLLSFASELWFTPGPFILLFLQYNNEVEEAAT